MYFAIIMAGGSGTRFWPLSRRDRPKQLLPLALPDKTLLAATAERALHFCDPENVLVVTNERLAEATRAELPDVPPENILAEPVGRNTAPCIGWATTRIARMDPNAVCAVMPADHHVADRHSFNNVLVVALGAAMEGSIVTVGIEPNRPETGFGYLEKGDKNPTGGFRVEKFIEKPDLSRAKELFASGKHLWNSGMFFFRAEIMLDAIRAHLPQLGQTLDGWSKLELAEEEVAVRQEFAGLESISIDHGVMERADSVIVVPGSFGWSDLGSFQSSWELAEKDANGNVLSAEHVRVVDVTNSYVRAPKGKLVALVGLDDVVVVDTEDALLVMPKSRSQDVRAIVELLREDDDPRL